MVGMLGKKDLRKLLAILISSSQLFGCDPDVPAGNTEFTVGGSASALTQQEFNNLPPLEQYRVADKLLGTLFKGVTAEEFFDLNQGLDVLTPTSTTFLSAVRAMLKRPLSISDLQKFDAVIDGLDSEGNIVRDDAKYLMDLGDRLATNSRPKQIPLARIREYPISRDMYVHWMAYFLANTILYSPGEEMETADMTDVQRMFRFLVKSLDEETSIRAMIRANLPSLARWRVSRSPENHALEAYELYLGLFDTEEDSIKGGIACKDLFLTTAENDYLVAPKDNANTSPQLILDNYFVLTCDDLYDVVAGHPLVIPRSIEVIINYFMPGSEYADLRRKMIQDIAAAGPVTYEDIFTTLLFSKEYLLNVERPKSFEENFFPLLDRLKWDPWAEAFPVDRNILISMTRQDNRQIYLPGMGWDVMSLKIGRLPEVPFDALSFANYHKALRESLFRNKKSYEGGHSPRVDAGDGLIFDKNLVTRQLIASLSLDEYIDFLFLNSALRKPSPVERQDLTDLVVNVLNLTNTVDGVEVIKTNQHPNVAITIFDYISRLPEIYYFSKTN